MSSDFVFKAVRFSSRSLAEWVDAASAVAAKQRTGREDAKANRSAFIVEAALELANVVLHKRLTDEHLLPNDHQPRATTGKCLVLEEVGRKPKKLVNTLHRVTGWDRQYLKRIVARAAEEPEVLLDSPTAEEIRVLKKATSSLGVKFAVKTDKQGVRTNIAMRPEEIEPIEEAARRTNHHLSPFLTWAALLKANAILLDEEDGEDDESEELLENEDDEEDEDEAARLEEEEDADTRITITSRLPVYAIEKMDEFCSDQDPQWTRTKFVEEASAYLAGVVEKSQLTRNLLPSNHSLNGERKMVSVKVEFGSKSVMTNVGATLNHNTTGFIVWAILAYLHHHDYL